MSSGLTRRTIRLPSIVCCPIKKISHINIPPWKLPKWGIKRTINFVRCVKLAKEAGYDGVEIMGPKDILSISLLPNVQTNEQMNGVAHMRIESDSHWRLFALFVKRSGQISSLFFAYRCWTWWRMAPQKKKSSNLPKPLKKLVSQS